MVSGTHWQKYCGFQYFSFFNKSYSKIVNIDGRLLLSLFYIWLFGLTLKLLDVMWTQGQNREEAEQLASGVCSRQQMPFFPLNHQHMLALLFWCSLTQKKTTLYPYPCTHTAHTVLHYLGTNSVQYLQLLQWLVWLVIFGFNELIGTQPKERR